MIYRPHNYENIGFGTPYRPLIWQQSNHKKLVTKANLMWLNNPHTHPEQAPTVGVMDMWQASVTISHRPEASLAFIRSVSQRVNCSTLCSSFPFCPSAYTSQTSNTLTHQIIGHSNNHATIHGLFSCSVLFLKRFELSFNLPECCNQVFVWIRKTN